MCVKAHVCMYEYLNACVLAFIPPGVGLGVGVGGLEPFQLLMHYRQIGPQIGLFAVD